VIIVSGQKTDGTKYDIPPALSSTCTMVQLTSIGLFFNDSKISDRLLSTLFKRIHFSQEDAGYYRLVTKVHLANSEVGRSGMQELQDLLVADDCQLASLDLSHTLVDGFSLVQSLKRNKSLTSLDLFNVPKVEIAYEHIMQMLNTAGGTSRLGYLRCDAFDLHENEKVLNLREQNMDPVAIKLLAALLKRNTTLQDLDLTASDLESEGAAALATSLETNTTLGNLRVSFNPALLSADKELLRSAAAKRTPPLAVELG